MAPSAAADELDHVCQQLTVAMRAHQAGRRFLPQLGRGRQERAAGAPLQAYTSAVHAARDATRALNEQQLEISQLHAELDKMKQVWLAGAAVRCLPGAACPAAACATVRDCPAGQRAPRRRRRLQVAQVQQQDLDASRASAQGLRQQLAIMLGDEGRWGRLAGSLVRHLQRCVSRRLAG
jgi:hypothetical protein